MQTNYFKILIILLIPLFFGCSSNSGNKKETNTSPAIYYTEQYRPQFHFTPEANWMNDPNGMVYYEGEYHLFYQYYPDSTVWGPMHWGHAISKDLVHWEHLPVAIYPDSLGWIFSGSAVADLKNTSGLGTAENPPLVAIYTYHNVMLEKSGSKTPQSQALAFSTDKGRTWTKYANNPVLESPGIPDFRDPKVFWHNETGKWVMILAVQDRVHLYSSPNLISWKFESEFGKGIGAHGGVWECPDLFPLKVEGSDVSKWVMLVNINPGGPNGGSANQYFTGEFDGKKFTPDETNEKWVDWGRDNYAGVTWSNVPETDGRRLFIGWMSNWQYANVVPTTVWRSATTIPRELSLINQDNSYLLVSKPVKEMEVLRGGTTPVYLSAQNISGEKEMSLDSITLSQSELIFDFNLENSSADSLGIVLENNLQEKLVIGYSAKQKQFFVDRRAAGPSTFSKEFAGISKTPYTAGGHLQLRIFVDVASTELFVDGGKLVMTDIVFPSENFTKLKVFSKGGDLLLGKAEFHSLKRIW
ncbi:MAG: glycoside hydrolase family 32 protein [Bacteroidota bacterium]|nr:glycoside hydrolase family 32 protein [Bacteroidota bacterium]